MEKPAYHYSNHPAYDPLVGSTEAASTLGIQPRKLQHWVEGRKISYIEACEVGSKKSIRRFRMSTLQKLCAEMQAQNPEAC